MTKLSDPLALFRRDMSQDFDCEAIQLTKQRYGCLADNGSYGGVVLR